MRARSPDLRPAGEVLHGGAIMAFADTPGAVATRTQMVPPAVTKADG